MNRCPSVLSYIEISQVSTYKNEAQRFKKSILLQLGRTPPTHTWARVSRVQLSNCAANRVRHPHTRTNHPPTLQVCKKCSGSPLSPYETSFLMGAPEERCAFATAKVQLLFHICKTFSQKNHPNPHFRQFVHPSRQKFHILPPPAPLFLPVSVVGIGAIATIGTIVETGIIGRRGCPLIRREYANHILITY